jgi:hypothetical protein
VETLVDVLKDPVRTAAVVRDGVVLIEEEVASKSGLTGMGIKAGYKTVKAVKPGIIGEALGHLLPDFAPILDPFYVKAREEGNVRAYFTKNAERIADALLGVTDGKRNRAKNEVMKRAYDALRPMAKKHTADAVPRLGDLVAKHVH